MTASAYSHAGAFERRGELEFWLPAVETHWPGLELLVTTRTGGRSSVPFSTLNLSLSTGDQPDAVRDNRARLRDSLGGARFNLLEQVHAAEVVRCEPGTPPARADGHWTDRPETVLVVGVADCAPLFVWDAAGRRVALVHAGWRGTARGILGQAIRTLCAEGSSVRDLHLAMGPSIGPCCYEVGEEVAAALPAGVVRRDGSRPALDLRAANREQALAAGLHPERVYATPPCTACHPERFFSHRRDAGRTGRMWALAWFA